MPAVAGYAIGFQKFVHDFDFQAELVEHELKHPYLGYPGRLDLAGFLFANSRSRRRAVIVDVKCGAPAPSHPYQTVAYAALVNAAGLLGNGTRNLIQERCCVYLAGDGTYTVGKHSDPADFQVFTCLLTTARIREHAGLVN